MYDEEPLGTISLFIFYFYVKFSIINQCFSVYGACTTGGTWVTVSGAAEAESNSDFVNY